MNTLDQKNFLYFKGNDKADILFHINSSSFYRIYDPTFMKDFRTVFYNKEKNTNVLRKLEEIERKSKLCQGSCGHCTKTSVKDPKQFTIHKLALVLTSKCNLRCQYCYANYGMYDYQSENDISEETLIQGLNYLMDNFKDISNIQFFGGEPSLCWKQIKATVEFFEDLVKSGRKREMPGFGIVTNGVCIHDELIEIMKKHNFQITISLDGPEEINNMLRYDTNRIGKYQKIYQNYQRMLQKGIKRVGIECTYTAAHIEKKVSLVELVQFFNRKFNCSVPHIVPVNIEVSNKLNVMNCLDEFLQYVRELVDYTFDNMMNQRKIASTAIILGIIYRLILHEGQQRICPAGVKTFSLSHDKRISPCFMYTSKQDISYGKIGDDAKIILEKAYTFDNEINNKEVCGQCRECLARTVCSSCLGSFEIDRTNVSVSNPIFCETIKYVTIYVIKKLSEIKGDPESWNRLNNFFRNGVYEE